jgi:hypothetical protein
VKRASVGRILLAIGGFAIVAGSFLPELEVHLANALHPGLDRAMPERSHWVVFQECEDMLAEPDDTLPAYYYTYYAVEAGGLAYLAAAGASLALSAAFLRARIAAGAFAAFHALALLALASGACAVWRSMPASSGVTVTPTLGVVALFGACGITQVVLGVRAVRVRRSGRHCAVDAANLLPAAFLLLANAGLYVALRRHPNWPAGGYLLMACGAAAALLGMRLRRDPRPA